MNKSSVNLLWLQAGSCGGCTMSVLGTDRPVAEELAGAGIEILWHPALSEESGDEALAIIRAAADGTAPLDILCVEGAALLGPEGTGRFQLLSGTGRPMADWIRDLAGRARYVVAVGTCATYGGVPSGMADPTDARGLQFHGPAPGGLLPPRFRSGAKLPVVNVAGCAPHPGWIVETLALLAADAMTEADLDEFGRPLFFARHLAHHGCGRNEFYEYKASAARLSDGGCLMENLGCRATQAMGDCNIRRWNGHGSCTDAGFTCIACTQPDFAESLQPFMQTPKVAGIPVNIPTDMPKAWFVALAALSKSATPDRVRGAARNKGEAAPAPTKANRP